MIRRAVRSLTPVTAEISSNVNPWRRPDYLDVTLAATCDHLRQAIASLSSRLGEGSDDMTSRGTSWLPRLCTVVPHARCRTSESW